MAVVAFHPGEILKDLYMEPLELTPGRLAKIIGLDRQRIQRLIKGQTNMTVSTAERLARAFSTTAMYWMNLQMAYDLQQFEKSEEASELDNIQPFKLDAA